MRGRPAIFGVGLLVASCVGNMSGEAADPQPAAVDSETGVVEGVVVYQTDRKRPWRYRRNYVRDRKKGHLAEAVVSLVDVKPSPPKSTGASGKAIVDQKDYNFIPETQAVQTGAVVTFTNSDPFRHDVTAKNSLQRFNIDLRQFDKIPRVLVRPGGLEEPLELTCAYHSAMRGWIFVLDHAYFAVTGESGKFRLDKVPAGTHQLVVVHPAGQLRAKQEIRVAGGETTRVEFRLSPDNLTKSEKP